MSGFVDLEQARAYHGHLGPNLVFGLKMGNYAVNALSARTHFGMKAEVHCPARPPISCIIDGVQLSTGCTMGKANISHVVSDGPVKAVFTNTDTHESITLQLVDGVIDKYLGMYRDIGEEQASKSAWGASDDEVFTVCSP